MGKDKLQWVPASDGKHPSDSIRAGFDAGEKVYVARAHHEGNTIPGKLHNTHTHVYVPYNMTEVHCHFHVIFSQENKIDKDSK
jgi:hypothetical protein